MASANDGARLGAVIDRDLVAERIAARTAPIPPFVRTVATAPSAPATGGALLVEDVDLARVEATRATAGLPLLPFVARAAIDAWGRGPVHLGTPTGVVRDAGSLRLRALDAALAAASPGDEATFTIVDTAARSGAAPGRGAVLCVGRVEERPVARPAADGAWGLAVRPLATLSLSYEPADLPDAAGWLAGLKERLEGRDWEVEL